jgi:hypothetical protein
MATSSFPRLKSAGLRGAKLVAKSQMTKVTVGMTKKDELIAYRKMLRIARQALKRIRDYEAGAHSIARNALDEIEQSAYYIERIKGPMRRGGPREVVVEKKYEDDEGGWS